MCLKIKASALFMWPDSWGTAISSFYHSDINLFFIDYACCKLNTRFLLLESNSRSYHYIGASQWRKNIIAIITEDRVIDGRLKREIKNWTYHTSRLFLLPKFFNILPISEKYVSIYHRLPSMDSVKRFPNFPR